LTFFFLTPFLQHPWFHLAYWLTMYLILFVAAPLFVFRFERSQGGKLPVTYPLSNFTRILGSVSVVVCAVIGLGMIFSLPTVNTLFPWQLTPLVGAIVGVWFCALAVTYAWGVWDGDWLRVRPIFYQALPTALLLMIIPLLHPEDLRPDMTFQLNFYYALAIGAALLNAIAILTQARVLEPRSTYATA
jgi:hypothetical protein